MLENWLKPLETEICAWADTLYSYQLGRNMLLYTQPERLAGLRDVQIAFIGIDAKAADKVRRALYTLSFPFAGCKIADIGNVRKNHIETVVPVLQELLTARILPILLDSSEQNLPYLLYSAYRNLGYNLNLSIVANKIPYSCEPNWLMKPEFFLNRILAQPNHYLFNISVLAYQSHFSDPKTVDFFDAKGFEHLRLGKIRQQIEDTEPLIRDADLLAFNLGAVQCAAAPAVENASPNGLTAEEACRIARYAGLSDKLSAFGLYNYACAKDETGATAQLAAQTIWYFIDGFYNRKQDYPLQIAHFNQYLVAVPNERQALTFWKSKRSERWWLEIQPVGKKTPNEHLLFPCSYSDYVQASEGSLSDRILLAFHRFQ